MEEEYTVVVDSVTYIRVNDEKADDTCSSNPQCVGYNETEGYCHHLCKTYALSQKYPK